MLSSIAAQAARNAVMVLAGYFAGRGYAWPPRDLRPASLVFVAIILIPLSGLLKAQVTLAQPSRAAQRAALSSQQMLQKKHNDATLMLLSGYPGTTYSNMAHDMAAVLTKGDGLRLIAIDTPGGMESLRDLLFLRGVDLALISRNILDYADATAAFGPGLRERLTYVTELYGEEVHILAGAGITSINDLSGKKLAVPPDDGNAEFTARDLLRRFHVEAEVVKVAAADAIDDVRSGALAALVLVGGKPLRLVAALPKDGSVRLLPLSSTPALGNGYSPSSFSAEDYPALIAGQQTIDALSVGAVLVANKMAQSEDSYRRIARFVPAFFGALPELSGPRWHPKWREVNLAAALSGWTRFPPAKEWLDTALQEQSASMEREFEEFLRVNSTAGSPVPSPAKRKQLFEEYLRWTRSTTGAAR